MSTKRYASRRAAGGIAAAVVTLGLVGIGSTLIPWAGRSEATGPSVAAILENRPEVVLGRSEDFDYDPPAPGSYDLPVIQAAGDGDVVGPDGEPARLRDLIDGRITVLSFIYTRCADASACPSATGMLGQIRSFSEEDPVLAENVRLVTLSFDPDHDTPDVMGKYGRVFGRNGKGAEWLFLTTRSHEELEPILRRYGQIVEQKDDPGDIYGPLRHTVRVYLVDRAGGIRNIYSFGLLDPRLVVTDIRTLLLEEARSRRSEPKRACLLLGLDRG